MQDVSREPSYFTADREGLLHEGEEAETSFGGTGLSATKTQFRNSVVDNLYKQLGYEPFWKRL